jgi:hypothetical protein
MENLSSFSVKKKDPNPQIPEPRRMLLPQKNECKSFLIFILSNVGIHSAGTTSPGSTHFLGRWLLELHGITIFNSRTNRDKSLAQLKGAIAISKKKKEILKMTLVPLGKSPDDDILDPASSSTPPGLRQ